MDSKKKQSNSGPYFKTEQRRLFDKTLASSDQQPTLAFNQTVPNITV